jgi:hypothetical protein
VDLGRPEQIEGDCVREVAKLRSCGVVSRTNSQSRSEQEFGLALSRISLDDMARHAERLNGNRGRDNAK